MLKLREIRADEHGQSLIEYALLLGFLALGASAFFIGAGGSTKGVWTAAGSHLEVANGAGQSAATPPSSGSDDHNQHRHN